MVPIIVMILELGFLLGGSAVTRAVDKSGDKNKSTKSLCLFVYNIITGLITLLIGIIGLENCQSEVEEVLYTGSKYLGIVWLVFGGVNGMLAVIQKLTEIGEAAAKGNQTCIRSVDDIREQKNNESKDTSSKPRKVIPAWEWAEMQKKKAEEAEEAEEVEEKKFENSFCVYCGAKLDDDQLFCGKCGKRRK